MVPAIKDFFMPNPVEVSPNCNQADFNNVLKARKRERIAKIVQAVAFIFATLLTTAVFAFMSISVVGLAVSIPLMVTAVACWALGITLKLTSKNGTKNLEDEQKQRLAKAASDRLFFDTPMKEFKNVKNISERFRDINRVLEMDAFDFNYFTSFERLDKWNNPAFENMSLYDYVQKHNLRHADKPISLAINKEHVTEYSENLLGPKKLVKHLAISWNGIKEPDGTMTVSAQNANNPNVLSFKLVTGDKKCREQFPALSYKIKINKGPRNL